MEETEQNHRPDSKEMKIFQTLLKNIATIGFTPNQQRQTKYRKVSRSQIIMITIFCINIGTLCVFFFYEANGIEQYMDVIYEFTVTFGIFIAFLSIIFKVDDIFNILELTEKEIAERLNKNPTAWAIHERTNRIVEFLSKFLKVGGVIFIPLCILPKVIWSYSVYFTTDSGNNAFDLPFQQWFPFDWKNPIGYLMAVIWQLVVVFVEFRIMAILLLPVPIGAFLFGLSFAADCKGDLRTLNKMAISKQSETHIRVQVAEFIRTHSNVRQLINIFLNVFEVGIFADVMCGTITLCVVMLMIQVEIISKDTIDPQVMWKMITYGSVVVILTFLFCEIGQRLTDAFEEITDQFKKLDWYLLPIRTQRLLPIIINNMHIPITIDCFGVVDGSRETFKRVVKIVYKTFNVLCRIFN